MPRGGTYLASMMAEFDAAKQAWWEAAEYATVGYRTELAEYKAAHPMPTLREFMVARKAERLAAEARAAEETAELAAAEARWEAGQRALEDDSAEAAVVAVWRAEQLAALEAQPAPTVPAAAPAAAPVAQWPLPPWAARPGDGSRAPRPGRRLTRARPRRQRLTRARTAPRVHGSAPACTAPRACVPALRAQRRTRPPAQRRTHARDGSRAPAGTHALRTRGARAPASRPTRTSAHTPCRATCVRLPAPVRAPARAPPAMREPARERPALRLTRARDGATRPAASPGSGCTPTACRTAPPRPATTATSRTTPPSPRRTAHTTPPR